MARCDLNTFMISLKARRRRRGLPSEAGERKRRFILTSGFISAVRFVISLYARRRRGRPSLTPTMQQCPPRSFFIPSAGPRFHFSVSEWLNYSDLCKWVVFIFPGCEWKLKVTRRDPRLLLKLNCGECAAWIIVPARGALLTGELWPPQIRSICTSLEESACCDPHATLLWRRVWIFSAEQKQSCRERGGGSGGRRSAGLRFKVSSWGDENARRRLPLAHRVLFTAARII